jgi:hypothetical protein
MNKRILVTKIVPTAAGQGEDTGYEYGIAETRPEGETHFRNLDIIQRIILKWMLKFLQFRVRQEKNNILKFSRLWTLLCSNQEPLI